MSVVQNIEVLGFKKVQGVHSS